MSEFEPNKQPGPDEDEEQMDQDEFFGPTNDAEEIARQKEEANKAGENQG